MQTDYTLQREIIRVCRDRYPNWILYSELTWEIRDRDAGLVLDHVLYLEDEGFLAVKKEQVGTTQETKTVIERVRLRNLDAARTLLDPPNPKPPIGFRPPRPKEPASEPGRPEPRRNARSATDDSERSTAESADRGHETADSPARAAPLFDDSVRKYPGRINLRESLASFLSRLDSSEAERIRKTCNDWFHDYSQDAMEGDINDFLSRFFKNKVDQHHAAWFELCVHQMLVQLGFTVDVHPGLHASAKRPDFAASADGSRILVEATTVRRPGPITPEMDAESKLMRLELGNFWATVENIEGTLDRLLTRAELDREFRKFFNSHDPDDVQRSVDAYGDRALPTAKIRFDDWVLTVSLLPAGPGSRAKSQGRVAPWSLPDLLEPSVQSVQRTIKSKEQHYGQTVDPLILAVNVHAYEFNPIDLGREILFGRGGIWSLRRRNRSNVAGVLFFAYTDWVSVPNTKACLFLNPMIVPAALPPTLLRLPHALGPDGSVRKDGEPVARILGF